MWPGKAAVPLAGAAVVPGDRLKRSENVWPGEKEARRRLVDGEDGAAGGESSRDILDFIGKEAGKGSGLSDQGGGSSSGTG